MSSIANGQPAEQVTEPIMFHGSQLGVGCRQSEHRPAIRPRPGLNLCQIITECLPHYHQGPAYLSIRGWLEGQGDPWLDALQVSDAWWAPAQAALPALLWLAAHWTESEVRRAVQDEAAAILKRRVIEADLAVSRGPVSLYGSLYDGAAR